jgi:hypothetical protein
VSIKSTLAESFVAEQADGAKAAHDKCEYGLWLQKSISARLVAGSVSRLLLLNLKR